MWYPATITVAAEAEPITVDQVKDLVDFEFADKDALIGRQIAAVRAHAEAYCGVRFATQTIAIKCDGFSNMEWLPEAPVQSVTSISYVDTAGATQTLPATVYELRADGLGASVALKYGQQWPAIQQGSRITLTAVVGYATAPDDVIDAMIVKVAEKFDKQRENAKADEWTTFDVLLCNHRRNA